VAAGVTEAHVPRGRTIFSRGDPCLGFHAVIYGQVKLSIVSPAGQEKIVEILGAGKTFGEAVMFLEQPYMVGATALEDSLLLHIAKRAVDGELESNPAFARRMLAGMSRRLHGLVADVAAYTLQTGGQRVAAYLLKDAPRDGDTVVLSASKRLVASRLNITPEYFSRMLHALAARGFVRVEGRAIAILDAAGLAAFQG
jgi:CRP-like cAMP-binding protein